MAGGVPYELHACPWAQACAQFQQLQPTHHRFASHARKKPTRFNHVRNKLLSPPLAPDHGTSVNDVGGCGAESGSGGGRQALQLSWLVGQPGQSGTGAGFRSWRVSWESRAPAACLPQATGLGGLWCGEALSDGSVGESGSQCCFYVPFMSCSVPCTGLQLQPSTRTRTATTSRVLTTPAPLPIQPRRARGHRSDLRLCLALSGGRDWEDVWAGRASRAI